MRISIIIIWLLVFTAEMVHGQPKLPGGGEGEPKNGPKGPAVKADTIIQSRIFSWKLSEDYSRKTPVELDTQTIGFHRYDPVYRASISNTHLGHVGAPYQSNIYFDRPQWNGFYFSRNLKVFAPLASETPFYNSTLSFSSLAYVQDLSGMGGSEQVFDAFMIRNIDPNTNLGFRFHVNVTDPSYLYLKATHRNFNIFLSRNTERYNGYLSIVSGSNNINENGGLATTKFNVYDQSILPVNLTSGNGLNNYNKTLSVFTSHEYFLGTEHTEMHDDSTNSIVFIPKFSAQYSAEWEQNQRDTKEPTVNVNFFENTYISTSSNHIDSIFYNRFSHQLQLKMPETAKRKFTFGKRVFIQNEIVSAVHPVPYGYRKYVYSNVKIGASIFRHESDFWSWSATGHLVLLGRNLGDALVKGVLEKPITIRHDTLLVKAEGWYRDQSPDIFQDHLLTNHYEWENKFKKQHDVTLKFLADYSAWKISAGANYALLSQFMYNNTEGVPAQYGNEFSVFSLWLKKTFTFWRFGWDNHLVWQEVSDHTVLRLPTLSAYSALYYSHFLFKVMKIQLGGEIYYNTPFKADNYNPATTQFFIQDDQSIGGFPVINAFANAKLKRTSAFIKMTHANSLINGNSFYMAPKYPLGQMVVRFGFLWSFYD